MYEELEGMVEGVEGICGGGEILFCGYQHI
ncbi:MAG: hypothetical protein ACI9Z3_001627 [Roseivirga sp.]|jgi:hypothetical protein